MSKGEIENEGRYVRKKRRKKGEKERIKKRREKSTEYSANFVFSNNMKTKAKWKSYRVKNLECKTWMSV
jgi:hypothetical protein